MRVYTFFTKKIVYIPLIALIILGGGFVLLRNNGGASFESQSIELVSVVHVVSETGVVRPVEDIELSFARGGRVAEVYVRKGSVVSRGAVLATLEAGSLDAELRQARAALELEKGAIQRTDLALTNAELTLADTVANVYVTADDVVQGKVDQLFTNPDSSSPRYGISITKGNTTFFIGARREESDVINNIRADVETKLIELQKVIFTQSLEDIRQVSIKTEGALEEIQKLLSTIALSLNNYVADDTNVQTVYESYKAEISTSRTRINNALTLLRTAMQNHNTALASVKTNVGTGDLESVRLREIRIEDAQARVDGIQARINDGYIRSPISGVVTEVYISKGAVAGAAAPALTLMSSGNHEISVNIPEADIQFVTAGDRARITFDAYRGDTFEGEVVFVPLQAKEIAGIKVFEVILEFSKNDSRIKAGLSVDVDILAEEKEGVMAVPRRAVVQEGGQTFVRLLTGTNSYKRQSVSLGLRGDSGLVEITEGLSEGDMIITFISKDSLKNLKETD